MVLKTIKAKVDISRAKALVPLVVAIEEAHKRVYSILIYSKNFVHYFYKAKMFNIRDNTYRCLYYPSSFTQYQSLIKGLPSEKDSAGSGTLKVGNFVIEE
jgi:hypothetical protein